MGDTILAAGPHAARTVPELQQQPWRGWSHGKKGEELVCSVMGMTNGHWRSGGKTRSVVGTEKKVCDGLVCRSLDLVRRV